MKFLFKPVCAVGLFSLLSISPVTSGSGKSSEYALTLTAVKSTSTAAADKVIALYDAMKLRRFGLTKAAFEYALKGYQYLLDKRMLTRASILSICDFSQSSRRKRFFVIDMAQSKVLINTYVAHGRRSGSEYARSFSNNPDSHMSSLGFYKTETTYYGDHGLALKIEGLEKGFNDRADARNIVLHGSKYVGADFLRYNRFNGRSFGCPAIPSDQTSEVINTIKNGSCLFIYHPTKKYLTKSKILNG
jgi:L,D-transpeptidase catalytic domain